MKDTCIPGRYIVSVFKERMRGSCIQFHGKKPQVSMSDLQNKVINFDSIPIRSTVVLGTVVLLSTVLLDTSLGVTLI